MKIIYLVIAALSISGYSNAQWVALNTGTTEQLNTICFVDQNTGYAAGNNGVIIKTTNGGTGWTTLNPNTSEDLNALYFFSGSSGIAAGNNGLILKTVNGGLNWNVIPSGLDDHLLSVSFSGAAGIIGGTSQSIIRSTNSGDSWAIIKSGFFGGGFRSAFMLNPSTGYVAGVNGIFAPLVGKTTDGGNDWNYATFYINSNEGTLQDICFINENTGITVSAIFDGTGGISRTANGGQNWTHLIYSYSLHGIDFPAALTGFAAGSNGLVLKTDDGGISWSVLNSNTSSNLKDVHFIDVNTGYAAGDNGTVMKTISGGVVKIKTISGIIPGKFELLQNYPNPFNPVTNIRFSLPTTQYTVLKVFDLTGREIATLVNENLQAGEYNYEFQITNYDLTSGVYFYTLKAGEFSQTRKMLLIK